MVFMLKGIIFDLDGTLIDSVDVWTEIWYRAFHENNIDVSREEIRRYIGLPLDGVMKNLSIYSKELKESVESKRLELIKAYAQKVKIFPDTIPALEFVKEKELKTCVASSSIEYWIRLMLKNFGIIKYVDAYVSGEDVKRPKPYPDVFIEGFKRIGIKPKEGMVVGDRESDTVPAMEIGAKAVLIDRFGEFDDPKADAVIKSLDELKNLID